MQKKQNSIRFRVMHEAQKRGSMDFLTLTYDNDSLPISHSLWSVERETGNMSLYGDPVICSDVPEYVRASIIGDKYSEEHHQMKSLLVKHQFSEFSEFSDFYLSYSPCHNYEDVKSLLKRIRKYYSDLKGEVADFSFLCVPEFGEHFSRRPHYHMCFFGAPELFVHFFGLAWSKGFCKPRAAFIREHEELGLSRSSFCTYEYAISYGIENFRVLNKPFGYVDTQHVSPLNNGFIKCAQYVGKYVGKGVFEDALVKDGFVHLPRIGISKYFGRLPEDMVKWHLCKDIFGDYDDDSLFGLSEDKINQIVPAVARRLIHSFGGKDYALPVQFLRQIFKYRIALSRNEVPPYLKEAAFSFSEWPPSGKAIYTALYYRVKDFIRDKYLQDFDEKFRSFVSHYPSENLYQAVAAFEDIRESNLKNREAVAFARKRKSLQSLMF